MSIIKRLLFKGAFREFRSTSSRAYERDNLFQKDESRNTRKC